MPRSSTAAAYWRGVIDLLPMLIVVVPFATLFGVLAMEAGLSVLEVTGFSLLVFAGASQLAALQLILDNAPLIVIITASLTVNLRMAMYSASLATHLGAAPLWQRVLIAYFNVDQTYALGVMRYETYPDMPLPDRVAYYFGVATPLLPAWALFTLIGALLGTKVPDGLGLDFALPLAFLAMVGPMLRTLAHMAAALASIVMALILSGLPSGLGLILAAIVAMGVGATVEVWMERRR